MKTRLLSVVFLLCLSSSLVAQQMRGSNKQSVTIENRSALDALLWTAEVCRQPLGIVATDKSITSTQIALHAPDIPCDDAFPRILAQLPKYASRNIDGVLLLEPMNRDEATERLFTTVIPSFEAREATTGQLSNLLWMDLQLRLDPTERGFATIYHSNDHSLLAPIRLQDITVKDVLNEIVRRRKSAAWIGFPAPVNLLNVPGDKLWNIVTYDDPPAAVTELCCLDRNNLPAN